MSPDTADARLDVAVSRAAFATVLGLALTVLALLAVRILNPDLIAQGAISLALWPGRGVNWDLLQLLGLTFGYLVGGVAPSLVLRRAGAERAGRLITSCLSLLVLIACLGLFGVTLAGGAVDYVQHFYVIVGGLLLAGSWLVAANRRPTVVA